MILIPYNEITSRLSTLFRKHGLSDEDANTCSEIFATNSLEGVHSHGLQRVPRFIEYLKAGHINPRASAVCKNSIGGMEQWDGQSGIGPINALRCTDRAMALATEHGIGCVSLANTNHWMRGGTYGWRAAKAGFAFIAWSNTIGNMPAWGAKDPRLGNNPLVIAVPHEEEAIVLDMAMSQFSFGAMELKQVHNEQLPVPGGYDTAGNLTTDPGAILASNRSLPIGYWKGAGLSLLLDLLATILSGGRSTAQLTAKKTEVGVSQIFIAISLPHLHNHSTIQAAINTILADYHASIPVKEGGKIPHPGQRVLEDRKVNREKGVPVVEEVWRFINGDRGSVIGNR